MIQAWRLSKARYAGDLSGNGAARDGQRWNLPGRHAVYLGLTPEITVLELLVHLNGVLSAPLVLCCFEVPDEPGWIARSDPEALPAGWDAIPHGQASATFGGQWLSGGDQLGLVLPSVVVPQASNLLLNPLHPAISQVNLAMCPASNPLAVARPDCRRTVEGINRHQPGSRITIGGWMSQPFPRSTRS